VNIIYKLTIKTIKIEYCKSEYFKNSHFGQKLVGLLHFFD